MGPAERFQSILIRPWVLGILVAAASWNVIFAPASPGNDGSWVVGLYMAASRGLHFGDQLIFTYGPLGFLSPLSPTFGGIAVVVDGGLAQLAFLYGTAIHLLLCVSLVWALRRTLNAALAALIAFAVVAAFPAIERPYVIAAVWCTAALAERGPPWAGRAVIFGGAALAATESLIRLTSGPAILAMCVIALLGRPGWRRELPPLLGTYVGILTALWFASGQALSNVPDFLAGAFQIVTGYSQAMASAQSGFKWDLAVLGGALAVAALAGAGFVSTAPRRRRIAAAALIAVAAFAAFKEGMVREDEPHLSILFATALGLSLAVPWRSAWRAPAAGLALGLAALAFAVATPPVTARALNPIDHLDMVRSQFRYLFDSGRRDQLRELGRGLVTNAYALDPATLRLLRGHRVHVDPSGAALIWAYGLDWRPLPVFQENSAYTSALDRDNVEVLESPQGPDRVLRGTPAAIDPGSERVIDGRFGAWNPPGVSLSMLCRLRSLRVTPSWQVLEPEPDRCGEARAIGSVSTAYGEPVRVPAAGPDEAVFARIHGAGVSGLERVRSALFRARFRFAVLNGGQRTYRLVPGTATDGLILSVPPRLDYPAPFALSPGARTLELTGAGGSLRIDFYAVALRTWSGG
jgi:hypothetical protein